MDKFAIMIIGNEVVFNIPLLMTPDPFYQERMIAAYTSNPTFVIHDKPVRLGWIHDGERFIRPS